MKAASLNTEGSISFKMNMKFWQRFIFCVCITLGCLLFLVFKVQNCTPGSNLMLKPSTVYKPDGRIPKRIHQIFDLDIPKTFLPWVKSWMHHNPDWEYWFWTDTDIRILLKRHLPKVYTIYDNVMGVTQKSDIARYAIIYLYGGFYFDMDMEALKPFDDWILNQECILPQEIYIHSHLLYRLSEPLLINCALACKPKHPFFKHLIDNLPTNINLKYLLVKYWDKLEVHNTTGPFYLTREYIKYTGSQIKLENSFIKNITVLTPEYIIPTSDKVILWEKLQKMCGESGLSTFQKKLCQDFLRGSNVPSSLSYTDHHWFHTIHWNKWWKLLFTRNINIMNVIPPENLYMLSKLEGDHLQ